MLNRSGPKIEPCGTPNITASHLLYEVLTLVFCFLCVFRLHWSFILPRSLTLLKDKDMSEFSGVGVAIRTMLAKHVSSFAPIAQHHLLNDISCNAIMENNFPWQHRWIFLRGENFDKSFTVPNVSIKFVSAFKHRQRPLQKRESKSHCLVTKV